MLKQWLKNAAFRRGYMITRLPRSYNPQLGYALHTYTDSMGKFDYNLYRETQTAGNKRKLHRVWAQEENVKFLAEYVRRKLGTPTFGLCHGTRRGLEQRWFSEALGCNVLGTEISDTASQFPNTIQWDFHDVKPEWNKNVDFIYSNSFDHSYDPAKCLDAWMSCLKPRGFCILEHSPFHGFAGADDLDPFGAELYQMPYLIARWGKGRYAVREILDAPKRPEELSYLAFLVIEHFSQ